MARRERKRNECPIAVAEQQRPFIGTRDPNSFGEPVCDGAKSVKADIGVSEAGKIKKHKPKFAAEQGDDRLQAAAIRKKRVQEDD